MIFAVIFLNNGKECPVIDDVMSGRVVGDADIGKARS
jgi:hypothetical protein